MYSTKGYLFILLLFYLNLELYQTKDAVRCELGAFIENEDGSKPQMIDRGTSSAKLSDCGEESQKECSTLVANEIKEGTKNGNFSLVVEEKDQYTIGDVLCDKADAVEENVRDKRVQIYWRLCGSEWRKTSFRMPLPLCCDDGLYIPCEKMLNK